MDVEEAGGLGEEGQHAEDRGYRQEGLVKHEAKRESRESKKGNQT